MNEKDQSHDSAAIKKAKRRATVLFTGLLGAVSGIVIVLLYQSGEPIPQFSKDDFEAAQQKWRSAAVDTYEIEIDVTGRQSATYRVKVVAGNVVEAFRNDRPLKQRRTMGTWSVPGMFDTMLSDVENRELFQSGKGDRNTPQVTLRCKFHPEYGFPLLYQRLEHRKFASNMEVTWTVTRFEAQ